MSGAYGRRAALMMRRPSRATVLASLVAATMLVWWVSAASAVAREVDALSGGAAHANVDRDAAPRPSPQPVPERQRGEPRRGFVVPPGHEARPAREAAPGHARREPAEPAEPAATPTGRVLGATPGTVRRGGGAAAPDVRVATAPRGPATAGRGGGGTDQGVTGLFTPGQVRSAGLAGAFLAIGGVPAGPADGLEIGAPEQRDPLAIALLYLVVATQVLAAVALVPVARRILGGFGTRRLG